MPSCDAVRAQFRRMGKRRGIPNVSSDRIYLLTDCRSTRVFLSLSRLNFFSHFRTRFVQLRERTKGKLQKSPDLHEARDTRNIVLSCSLAHTRKKQNTGRCYGLAAPRIYEDGQKIDRAVYGSNCCTENCMQERDRTLER